MVVYYFTFSSLFRTSSATILKCLRTVRIIVHIRISHPFFHVLLTRSEKIKSWDFMPFHNPRSRFVIVYGISHITCLGSRWDGSGVSPEPIAWLSFSFGLPVFPNSFHNQREVLVRRHPFLWGRDWFRLFPYILGHGDPS